MTIKTTGSGSGLRVITKTVDGEVRVSCECCAEAACCMYHATAVLGGAYGLVAEDYPEKIIYNGIEATRSISSYSGIRFPQYFSFGHPPSAESGSTTRAIMSYTGRWIIVDGLGYGFIYGSCLISPLLILQPHEILDVFADTYTVTGLPDFWPQQSVQIERKSLCQWKGDAGGQETRVVLTYWDGSEDYAPSGANQIGWWLTVGEQGSNAIRKTGYQSSPDGSYGGFTVL